jgi:hypothetical protein
MGGGGAEGVTWDSGGAAAPDKGITVWHLGHLICLPAAVSGARKVALQPGQVTLIGIGCFPAKTADLAGEVVLLIFSSELAPGKRI